MELEVEYVRLRSLITCWLHNKHIIISLRDLDGRKAVKQINKREIIWIRGVPSAEKASSDWTYEPRAIANNTRPWLRNRREFTC